MAAAILRSKLRIPSVRPDQIPRPHLLARLDEGLSRRVSLLCAPAGYGKSTLMAEWARSRPTPTGWLSLDAGENDLARFLAYLVAALGQAQPEMTMPVPVPGPDRSPSWYLDLLTALTNQLGELPGEMVLVLDDYHQIEAHLVHQAVEFLVQHLPPQAHMVVASRMDPPISLARLRARGQLLELRARDLRFSEQEVSCFLERITASGVPRELAATLAARTEGWPAALQLAGLSLRGRSPQEMKRFICSFSGEHPYVADYLAGDVLEQQPESVRRFLLETAILERMAAPLCAAVLGDEPDTVSHRQRQLEGLEQANLFVVPLDEERHWYRYHHLFSDLLRRRLQETQPHRIPELHRRASRWFEAQGMHADAIHHAFRAGESGWAEALIRRAALPVLLQGQSTTVYNWLSQLGPARVAASPTLTLLMGWTHLAAGDLPAAAGWLQSLTEELITPAYRPILHLALAVLAWLQGQIGPAESHARQVLDGLALTTQQGPGLDGAVAHSEGVTRPEGEGGEPAPALTERLVGLEASRAGAALGLLATTVLGESLKAGGRVRDAAAAFRQGLAGVEGTDLETGWAALVGNLEEKLALLLYEQNDLAAGRCHAERGLTLASQTRNTQFEEGAYGVLALIRQAEGEPAEAQRAMDRARAIARQRGLAHEEAYYEAAQARLWLAQGSPEAAAAWLRGQPPPARSQEGLTGTGRPETRPTGAARVQLRPGSDSPEPQSTGALAVVTHYLAITRVRVLLAVGPPQQALAEARTLRQVAAAAGLSGVCTEVAALEALALRRLGQEEAALGTLAQALETAAREGYARSFLDLGPPMVSLLREFAHHAGGEHGPAGDGAAQGPAPAVSYARRLLALMPPPAAEPAAGRAPVEPLSSREQEVLALLAQGLRNREIARRMVVTEGTVKRHVSNLCGKLGASSRTQAVLRGQELGLLPRSTLRSTFDTCVPPG